MFNNIDLEYDGAVTDPKASWLMAVLSVTGLGLALSLSLLNYDAHNGGLRPYVDDSISMSGVTNPVTAVLVNFRAYDTLLEIAVLLIVVIAVLPAHNHKTSLVQRTVEKNHALALLALQRWIAPAVIIFAGYLLWAGANQPGGAFQAGALLAAACLLMFQAGAYRINYTSIMARSLMALGLAVFIAVGTALIYFEGNLLAFPPDNAGWLILLIESSLTVSIATAFASLYCSISKPSSFGSTVNHGSEA